MYINDLASKFKINILGITKIFFLYEELLLYNSKATEQIRYLYLKKIGKVIFSIVVTRLNNIQALSKLIGFLINPGPNYLKVINYKICYLVLNKYLTIKYKTENKNSKLITITDKIFIIAANALYKNNLDKKSGEEYIFKLFRDAIN